MKSWALYCTVHKVWNTMNFQSIIFCTLKSILLPLSSGSYEVEDILLLPFSFTCQTINKFVDMLYEGDDNRQKLACSEHSSRQCWASHRFYLVNGERLNCTLYILDLSKPCWVSCSPRCSSLHDARLEPINKMYIHRQICYSPVTPHLLSTHLAQYVYHKGHESKILVG